MSGEVGVDGAVLRNVCEGPVRRRDLLPEDERSGHTPQLEEPERFDQLLLDWLEVSR